MGKIRFFSEGNILVKIKKRKMKEFINSFISEEGYGCGDINIVFCNDEYLIRLNSEYLKHDYYTDIITFDYTSKNSISGEMFISVERVWDNARIYGQNSLWELHRVIFHGVLHLLGYKDKSTTDKKKMREKEDYYLQQYFQKT